MPLENLADRIGKLGLPDELLERVSSSGMFDLPRELRLVVAPLTHVKVRDASETGDGSWTMEGYAAVYEAETVLFNAYGLEMREIISRDAFGPVLATNPLVHFNHGHDMMSAVAATNVRGIGGLELGQDFHGLRYHARVDPADPDALRLAAKMKRGVVAQASFAFTVGDGGEHVDQQETLPDGTYSVRWRIDEVNMLYDVCACAQGAYPQTESHLRTLVGASIGRSLQGLGHPDRASAGRIGVAPSAGVVDQEREEWERERELASARARAAAGRLTHPDPRRIG